MAHRNSLLLISLLVLRAASLAFAVTSGDWRRGTLAESGKPYWWRQDDSSSDDPEIRLSEPPDAWKVGSLDSGDPYLWRSTADGEQEVQIWRKSFLDSGAPFWWRMTDDDSEEVRLADPYEEHAGAPAVWHDEL